MMTYNIPILIYILEELKLNENENVQYKNSVMKRISCTLTHEENSPKCYLWIMQL